MALDGPHPSRRVRQESTFQNRLIGAGARNAAISPRSQATACCVAVRSTRQQKSNQEERRRDRQQGAAEGQFCWPGALSRKSELWRPRASLTKRSGSDLCRQSEYITAYSVQSDHRHFKSQPKSADWSKLAIHDSIRSHLPTIINFFEQEKRRSQQTINHQGLHSINQTSYLIQRQPG